MRKIGRKYLSDHPGGGYLSFFYRHHNQRMAYSLLYNLPLGINLDDEEKVDFFVLTALSKALSEGTTKNSGELLDSLLCFVNVHYPGLYDRFEKLKNIGVNSNLAVLEGKLTERRLALENIIKEIKAENKRQPTTDDVKDKIKSTKVRISNQLKKQVELQQTLEKKRFKSQREQLEFYKTFPYIKAFKEELAELAELELLKDPIIEEAEGMKNTTLNRLEKEQEFIKNDIEEIKDEKAIKNMLIKKKLNSKSDILKHVIDEELTKLKPKKTESINLGTVHK